jgi:ribosome-binding factor A
MRKTRRTSKVGEMVRDALVEVFRFDMKDLSLGLASITSVEVAPDLHFARVYISGFQEEETKETVRNLQNARGKIRKHLGQRIRLRFTPELDFKFDETTMRAGRIESILQEVKAKADKDAAEGGATQNDDDDR